MEGAFDPDAYWARSLNTLLTMLINTLRGLNIRHSQMGRWERSTGLGTAGLEHRICLRGFPISVGTTELHCTLFSATMRCCSDASAVKASLPLRSFGLVVALRSSQPSCLRGR